MKRIRAGLILTALLTTMFAAVSLLDSLYWFGIWCAIAAAAVIGQDVIAHIEHRNWQRDNAMRYHPSNWGRDV